LRFVGSLVLFAVLVGGRATSSTGTSSLASIAFWAVHRDRGHRLPRRVPRAGAGNLITSFGRIADPFVDKVLVIGAMVYLAVLDWSHHWFPAWIVVPWLAREFLVTGIRGYVESQGLAFPPTGSGRSR
jgi:hypothetical protein